MVEAYCSSLRKIVQTACRTMRCCGRGTPWQDHDWHRPQRSGATASPTPGKIDPQMDFLMAEAGKAFTTFEAFFAATFTSLPNIMRLPAGRAGLCFSLSITT